MVVPSILIDVMEFKNLRNCVPSAFFASIVICKKTFFGLLAIAPKTLGSPTFSVGLTIVPSRASHRTKLLFPFVMNRLKFNFATAQAFDFFLGDLWSIFRTFPRAVSPVVVAGDARKFLIADAAIHFYSRKVDTFWHGDDNASHI